MTEETDKQIIIDKPYIKLSRNTKGYNWDIKVIGSDTKEIERIDKELKAKFTAETGESK